MRLWSWILDLLFPVVCCHCQLPGFYLCNRCFDQIQFSLTSPLQLPELDSLTVMAEYQAPLSTLILTAKYQYVAGIGQWLGQLLYRHTRWPPVDAITFVPADPFRLKQRGFHLPQQMARSLSDQTQLPLLELLQKTHATRSQVQQSNRQQRQQATQNLFTIRSTLPPNVRSLLLIDDVVTTGATLTACALVLKKAGVTQVHGLTIAHGQ